MAGAPRKYNRTKRFHSVLDADILEPFENIVKAEGRSVTAAVLEFMQAYVNERRPKLKDTTLDKHLSNDKFMKTPELFDKASIWQNFDNGCTDTDILNIIDQLDALAHSHRVILAMRRAAKSKKIIEFESEIKRPSYQTALSSADKIVDEVFERAAKQ